MSTELLSESGPPLTEQEIEVFEARTGKPIPRSYRDFLMRYNGGYPDVSDFVIPGKDGGPTLMGTVERFLGIGLDSEYGNIDRYLKVYRDRVPEDYYPIATDPGSNLILMKTTDPGAGSIHFWDHEEEAEEGEPPTEQNIYPVGNSLYEFIGSLQ